MGPKPTDSPDTTPPSGGPLVPGLTWDVNQSFVDIQESCFSFLASFTQCINLKGKERKKEKQRAQHLSRGNLQSITHLVNSPSRGKSDSSAQMLDNWASASQRKCLQTQQYPVHEGKRGRSRDWRVRSHSLYSREHWVDLPYRMVWHALPGLFSSPSTDLRAGHVLDTAEDQRWAGRDSSYPQELRVQEGNRYVINK